VCVCVCVYVSVCVCASACAHMCSNAVPNIQHVFNYLDKICCRDVYSSITCVLCPFFVSTGGSLDQIAIYGCTGSITTFHKKIHCLENVILCLLFVFAYYILVHCGIRSVCY
jgi:hypothetical protein